MGHFQQDEVRTSVSCGQASCHVLPCHQQGTNKWSLGSQPRPAWTGARPPTPCRAAPTAPVRMKLASHCGENGHLIPEPCVRIQSHNPVPCTEINF